MRFLLSLDVSVLFLLSVNLMLVYGQGGGLTVYPDCVNGPLAPYAICDASLPALTRADSLLSLLNISEKVWRLGQAYGNNSVDRIGLPVYHWRQNAEHGLCGGPLYTEKGETYSNNTMFPHVAGMTASFNRSLWWAVGSAIADESRAFSNVGRAGLDWFTPNINIARDPRWGRTIEVPGEDPYLSAEYAANFIQGMQVGYGEDRKYYKTIATAKHFVAYDLDHVGTIDRSNYNAIVSPLDMAETYLPSWVSAVQRGKAGGVMCSYNAVNGVPVCASDFLLGTVLRDHLQFDPYAFVVSDCGAISNIYGTHHYAKTPEEAVAFGIKAGTDINCGVPGFYSTYGVSAYEKGLITEEDMNVLLRRHFVTLIRLGYFDSDQDQPYRHYGPEKINSPQTERLAYTAALQSFTLLKNENRTLPLSKSSIKVLALIGPNANVSLIGSNGTPSPYIITIWDGFVSLTEWKIIYVEGCAINSNDTRGFAAAIAAASSADAVVYVGGVNTAVEDEEKDRVNVTLPGVQFQLIQAISQAAQAPITLLLVNGGGLDVTAFKTDPKIGAIAWIGYPGQSAGTAVVTVLVGDYSPSGRLVVTWYNAHYLEEVQYTDQSMRPSVNSTGRTYKFFTGTPVYPFGHGLSYSQFNYTYSSVVNGLEYNIDALPNAQDSPISYSVNITNLGPMVSDVTALAFISANVSYIGIMPPIRQLFDFTHVDHLRVGETAQVWFTVTLSSLYHTDPQGHQWLIPGEYTITLNNEAPIQHTFRLSGNVRLMNKFPGSNEIITPIPRALSSAQDIRISQKTTAY